MFTLEMEMLAIVCQQCVALFFRGAHSQEYALSLRGGFGLGLLAMLELLGFWQPLKIHQMHFTY